MGSSSIREMCKLMPISLCHEPGKFLFLCSFYLYPTRLLYSKAILHQTSLIFTSSDISTDHTQQKIPDLYIMRHIHIIYPTKHLLALHHRTYPQTIFYQTSLTFTSIDMSTSTANHSRFHRETVLT